MLMSKANRVAIYELLFKEGVMVAEKNTKAPKHPELETIPNLQVIKADQPEVPWLCQGTVRLETFLLVPHQRRYPVPARIPAPAYRASSENYFQEIQTIFIL